MEGADPPEPRGRKIVAGKAAGGETKWLPELEQWKQQLPPPARAQSGNCCGAESRQVEHAAVWEARGQRAERGGPLLTERSCPLPFLFQVIGLPTPTGTAERILPHLTLEGRKLGAEAVTSGPGAQRHPPLLPPGQAEGLLPTSHPQQSKAASPWSPCLSDTGHSSPHEHFTALPRIPPHTEGTLSSGDGRCLWWTP